MVFVACCWQPTIFQPHNWRLLHTSHQSQQFMEINKCIYWERSWVKQENQSPSFPDEYSWIEFQQKPAGSLRAQSIYSKQKWFKFSGSSVRLSPVLVFVQFGGSLSHRINKCQTFQTVRPQLLSDVTSLSDRDHRETESHLFENGIRRLASTGTFTLQYLSQVSGCSSCLWISANAGLGRER